MIIKAKCLDLVVGLLEVVYFNDLFMATNKVIRYHALQWEHDNLSS